MYQRLDDYKAAARFRRRASRALRGLGLSFADWRVLEALCRFSRAWEEPLCHLEVAEALCIDQASVWRIMRKLARRGLVSHDIDAYGQRFRVWPCGDSEALVEQSYSMVASAGEKTGAGVVR